MNKKRWMALGLGIIILVASVVVPSFQSQEEVNPLEMYGQMNPFMGSFFNSSGRFEEIVEDGNPSERIALVSLEGMISASSTYGPGYDHKEFLEQLKALQEDDSVKGLLFVLNTNGGGVFESEEIRQEIIKLKEKMPVYASIKQMAASGGYYIAAETDKIYAYNDSITGSIGVILSSMDMTDLYKKLGIEISSYTSGDLKSVNKDSDEKIQEEEAKILQALVDECYGRFVDIIVNGRGMTKTEVKKLADGRIYTANQAKDKGLLDEIGTTEDALDALIEESGLTEPQVFTFAYPVPSNFSSMFMRNTDLDLLKKLDQAGPLRSLRPYYIYGGE